MSFEFEVQSGTSIRLPTAGKYCDRDIVITGVGGSSGEVENLDQELTDQEDLIFQLKSALDIETDEGDGYKKELNYLESTGTQYIDTGITINTSTDEVELVFQNMGTQVYKWFFGEHDNNARFGLGTGDGTNKRNVAYGNQTYKVIDEKIYDAFHTFKADSQGVFIDNEKVANFQSFSSTSTLYLFNLNLSGGNYVGNAKISSYKHKRNGALIADLIPVLDLNGVPCMYDKISKRLYHNDGTGEFLYQVKPSVKSNKERIEDNNTELRGCVENFSEIEENRKVLEDSLIAKTLTEYQNLRPITIGNRFFSYCYNLVSVDLPNAVHVSQYAFVYCTSLQEITLPSVTVLEAFAFQDSSALTRVDLHQVKALQSNVFTRTNLTTLILRKTDSITTNNSTAVFNSTPISRGEGYIYVPAALLESYKTATNWVTYANQIRAIEDYPDICG